MNIEFLKARNEEKTFTVNSMYYHSSYNPSKEAERFTQDLKLNPGTKYLILIEPGFSYAHDFLKQKYPELKIGVIRIINSIVDDSYDFKIDYSDDGNLYNSFLKLTEDELLNTQVTAWPVAEKIFPKEVSSIWNTFLQSLEYAKTVLITRQYFEKKWLLNSISFFCNISKIDCLKETQKPVVITASGPSLKNAIPVIKQNKEKITLVALSSSISPLLSNDIIPDLCLSTDGGYWARKHLKKLVNHPEIPLLLSSEANTYKKILNDNPVIPLNYEDGISGKLFDYLKIPYTKAKRNGTVSGTALSLFNNQIYFCGLDLAFNKGFSHTQPNELETENSIFDTRIAPKEKRITKSGLNTQSVKIYENWFKDQKDVQTVIRVIDTEYKKNNLGLIKDIDSSEFEKKLNGLQEDKTPVTEERLTISFEQKKEIKAKLNEFIKTYSDSSEWKTSLFPLDFISLSHCTSENDKNHIEEKINTNNNELIQKIRAIIDAE